MKKNHIPLSTANVLCVFMHARRHGAHVAAIGGFIVLLILNPRMTIKRARRLWTIE